MYLFEEQEGSTAESHSDYGSSGDEAQSLSGNQREEDILKSMSHSSSTKKHSNDKCDSDAGLDGSRLHDDAGPSNFKGKPLHFQFF